YRHDPWAAWKRLTETWPKLGKALMLRMEGTSVELHNLRARAALAAAITPHAPNADASWSRSRLLRVAAEDAQTLTRRGIASARPFASAIRAGIAHAEGQLAAAQTAYVTAATELATADMGLYAAAMRLRAATLAGGDAGAREPAATRDWFHTQRVKNV